MEQLISKCGKLTWNIIDQWQHTEPSGAKQMLFKVSCSVCGYERSGRKYDVRTRATCPNCNKSKKTSLPMQKLEKPPAVKLDDSGVCVSICDIGTVEFVRDYQETHGVSEREAVNVFVESARANLSEDDPIQDQLTSESVRSKVRRQTGIKANPDKKRGERGSLPQVVRKYKVEATPEAVTSFIEEYLPGYKLIRHKQLELW